MKTRDKTGDCRGRCGSTLLELLIASALTAVVLSQVGLALISSMRMFESTFADIELSLQSRALREKLLYRLTSDGGLMNACQKDLKLVHEANGSGTGSGITFMSFTPDANTGKNHGRKNTVELSAANKLVADETLTATWLECGAMVFQGDNIFCVTNGTVEVTLDVAIPVSNRKYVQRSLVKAQIMNE